MVSLKKTKPTPFQKDTWLSRTFWQHSERSDLKINFQGITRRGFNCPFVLAGPETTSGGADGGRELRREDTIRESGRAQAAAHSLQQLKACRWKWAVFSAGENPHSSSGYQTEPDLQAEEVKPLVLVPQRDRGVSKEGGSHPAAKWVFLEKSLSAALSKVHNYLSRTFFVIIGALCQQINCSELGSSNKTHTSGP